MCAANNCFHEAHTLVQNLAILFAKFNQSSHVEPAKGDQRVGLPFHTYQCCLQMYTSKET